MTRWLLVNITAALPPVSEQGIQCSTETYIQGIYCACKYYKHVLKHSRTITLSLLVNWTLSAL